MKLGNAALGKLARMICGDQPYDGFPYRSSSYLTSFFEEIDLDYVHDGSTRYWWVRSVLIELNDRPEASEALPSSEMVTVIEYLVDPDHFSSDDDFNLGKNVVPLTQHIEDIPSDLKPHRALLYLRNEQGLQDLRGQLAKRLKTLRERQSD